MVKKQPSRKLKRSKGSKRNTARSRKPARPRNRITPGAGAGRNTPRVVDDVARIAAESAFGVVPMKANAQLDAFPSSENARLRQSKHKRAVVSIRMKGDTIARLDALVDKENEGRGWNFTKRSTVILRAVEKYLAAVPS